MAYLSGSDIPDVDSFILIKWYGFPLSHDFHFNRRNVLQGPPDHPPVTRFPFYVFLVPFFVLDCFFERLVCLQNEPLVFSEDEYILDPSFELFLRAQEEWFLSLGAYKDEKK